MQGWTARVLAIWYDILGSNGCFQGVTSTVKDRRETYDSVIEQLTPVQFLDFVECVRQRAFTYKAWTGHEQSDKEFVSMCRYLQEAEAFMTVRYAVQHGDIGLIRRLVDSLCVWFYGAEQSNYGYEMLYLRWLLTDGVATAELQQSILASSLVNLAGRPNTFKAIDLALEHVNCCYAIDLKMHKNSTHDVDKTFGRLALASSYITHLRAAVETYFGENTNSKHSEKSAVKDIFSLAYHLWNEGCTQACPVRSASSVQFESPDILLEGIELLEEKVKLFNTQNVVTGNRIASILADEELEDTADSGLSSAITDYVDATDDTFYIEIDPILNTGPDGD